jgi:hypothetical protein
MEPVISSLAGGCLPPPVTFRTAKTPNTRMVTPATASRVRRLRVSRGMAKRCRTIEHPKPRRRGVLLREWEFYSTGANSFLETAASFAHAAARASHFGCEHSPAPPTAQWSVCPGRELTKMSRCTTFAGALLAGAAVTAAALAQGSGTCVYRKPHPF